MKRSLTIDLARGFTVLCIAPIHTLLVYSQPYTENTLTGKLLAFIAEWHGAQIFMLLMGISITFKSPQPLQVILKRSGILLVAAFALNIFKFVIPYLFHGLPQGLLDLLDINSNDHPILHLIGIGDILLFAAIAYFIIAAVYNQKKYPKIALLLAALICFFGPLFYDSSSCNPAFNYILEIFTGRPPQIFFPVFPWLIYPLLGLCIGSQLKKEKPLIAFDSLWLAGAGLVLIIVPIKYFLHDHQFSLFYRTDCLDTCIHVAAVFIFLSVWNWIALNMKPNALFQLFGWASRKITLIYLIQWILVMWLMPIFGFRDLGFLMSILAMAATSLITLSLCLAFGLACKKPE